ncbi:MAG: hypothetical protein ACI92E_002672 [Oceanicoccus sp.]|jgi:hypothetical protein
MGYFATPITPVDSAAYSPILNSASAKLDVSNLEDASAQVSAAFSERVPATTKGATFSIALFWLYQLILSRQQEIQKKR